MDQQPEHRYTVGRRLLGQAIRERRELRGLTIRQLAEASGISFDSVRSIETGRRMPSLQTLDELAVALSTSTAAVLQDAWPWNGAAAPTEGSPSASL